MSQGDIPNILSALHKLNQLKSALHYKSLLLGQNNTVGDHSWRLAFLVSMVAQDLQIEINVSHAMAIALVHDLCDVEHGDMGIPEIVIDTTLIRGAKAAQNFSGSDTIFDTQIEKLWHEYERQHTTEAKFVKALDTIEGFLNLNEKGNRVYLPQAFSLDYAEEAVQAFDNAISHFPPLRTLLDPIKDALKMASLEEEVKLS